MIKLIQAMCHLLEEGEDVVLATVIDSAGSTPRTKGSQMVVDAQGRTIETIGGGLVEAEVIKLAPEVFRAGRAQAKKIELTGRTVAKGDQMICGGRMEILLEFIAATQENQSMFRGLLEALQNNPRSYRVMDLTDIGGSKGVMKRYLIQETRWCGENSLIRFPCWRRLPREPARKDCLKF